MHGICTLRAQILYLSKGPQEIQLGKAGSSLEKKEPKQQVNHAVVRACLASLACLYTQALQAGFPGYPGYPGRLTHWQTVPGYAGSAQVKLRICHQGHDHFKLYRKLARRKRSQHRQVPTCSKLYTSAHQAAANQLFNFLRFSNSAVAFSRVFRWRDSSSR